MRKFLLTLALMIVGVCAARPDDDVLHMLGDLNGIIQQEAELNTKLKNATNYYSQHEICMQLSVLLYDDVREIHYLKKLAALAQPRGDKKTVSMVLERISRNYRDRGLLDSLNTFVDEQLKTVTRHDDAYYHMKYYQSLGIVANGDASSAYNLMLEIRHDSDETGNEVGKYREKFTEGAIYIATSQYAEAAKIYTDLLKNSRSTGFYRSQVYMYLIRSYLRSGKFDLAEENLNKWGDEIERLRGIDKLFASQKFDWVRKGFLIDLYYRTGRGDQAREIIVELKNRHDYQPTVELLQEILPVCVALDIDSRTNDEMVLKMIDWLVKQDTSHRVPWYLSYKALLYNSRGEKEMGAKVYKQVVDSMRSALYESYQSEFEQFKLVEEHFKQEKERRDELMRQNNLIIAITAFVLLLLAIVTMVIVAEYRRNRRIRHSIEEATHSHELEQAELDRTSENLEAQLRAAEESNAKEMRFITSMSNEIRTPLNVIYGFADTIASESEDNPDLHEFTLPIIQNCDLILKLIDDIIEVCKLNSIVSNASIKEVDIAAIARQMLRTMEPLVQSGVKLSLVCPDTLMVYSDDTKMQELLANLLGNACKFTSAGSITLRVEDFPKMVRISVTDTGSGIPAADRDKLFKRYAKLSEIKQGTGLGLYICHTIATQLHSRIYIDPSYNKGTRFVFEHTKNLNETLQAANDE